MDDLETRLREELHHAVDHVEASPGLWEEIRRRHRREPRTRVLEVATSLAVLALVAAVAFPFARGLVSEPDSVPAGPPDGGSGQEAFGEVVTDGPLPVLEGGELAPMLGEPTGPVPVLATGEIDGQRWMFTAFENNDFGGVSYGFPQPDPGMAGGGSGGGSDSNPLVTPHRAVGIEAKVTGGFVWGAVTKEAATVRAELPSGEAAEFPVIGADEDFEVNFFVVPVANGIPLDGTRLTALDPERRDVASAVAGVPADPPPALGLEPASGPVVAITSGELEGGRWELLAHNYLEGICYGVSFGRPNPIADSSSCDPYEGMPMAGAVSVVVDGGSDLPTFVYGVVRKEAAVVRVEFPDGTVHDVSPVGRDLDFPVAFYALVVPPAGARADVRAYDDAGNELGSPPEPLGPEFPSQAGPTPEPPESGSSPLGLEPPTGPVVTLDSGEIEGMPWEFLAYRWDEGICFGFRNEQGMAGGGVAVCDPAIPGIGVRGDGGEGQPAFVWGAFPRDTEVIRIQLIDGYAFQVPPLGQEEFGVSFFVRVLPTGTPMEGVRAAEIAQNEGIGDPVPTTTTTTPPG